MSAQPSVVFRFSYLRMTRQLWAMGVRSYENLTEGTNALTGRFVSSPSLVSKQMLFSVAMCSHCPSGSRTASEGPRLFGPGEAEGLVRCESSFQDSTDEHCVPVDTWPSCICWLSASRRLTRNAIERHSGPSFGGHSFQASLPTVRFPGGSLTTWTPPR